MLEELGDQRAGELIFVQDDEAISGFVPADQVRVLRLLEKAGGRRERVGLA